MAEVSLPQNDFQELLVTPGEAKERGLTWNYGPPKEQVCQFCGRVIIPKGIVIGSYVLWQPALACDCEQAVNARKEQEEQEKREAEAEKKRAENEERQRRIKQLLGGSGLKKRFMQRTFENFQTDTAGRKKSYKMAKEYADRFGEFRENGKGLYIEGTNGTGKTHLAAAIALQLIGEGIPVICKTASDMLADIKKTYDTTDGKEYLVVQEYETVDLLIIDDLGKERCSEWSMSMLYTILNERYEAMRPTIITTNYNWNDLIKALTPKGSDDQRAYAIVSRLRETNAVMTMAWKDCRGNKDVPM